MSSKEWKESKEWKDLKNNWHEKANKVFLGRKIVKVEWMSDREMNDQYWYNRPICLLLDDGTWIYPMADDEGNNGGALATTSKVEGVFPVFQEGD